MIDVTIGTDPEVFLTDQLGKYVSAHDLIPGSKHEPYPVQAGALQPDGVSAEFNTIPAMSEDMFVGVIKHVMAQMTEHIHRQRPDLTITITPTATFDREYFDALPDEATVLGCTPDFDAWSGEQNCPPSTTEPFRTGSGHIHLGFTKGKSPSDKVHFDQCCQIVKQLDCILYPASLLWDDDQRRRTLYGKIGAFRPKSYGVEYRPMANAYLKSEYTQRYVFRAARWAFSMLMNNATELLHDPIISQFVFNLREEGTATRGGIEAYLAYLSSHYGAPEYEG